MAGSLRDKSLTAFFWLILDKLGGSSINFIVTIVLAWLLTPKDFGLVAMVMVFFEISSTFIQSGFAFALIREKTISEIDKSTTFVFNFVTAVLFYLLLFFCAPAIARFFNQDILTAIIRIMGLNLIVESFAIIQHAVLTQRIDFKTQTKVRFLAVVISGVSALILAYFGYGVWSLVGRIGIMTLMSTIFLWVVNPWKFSLKFSRQSFLKLFGFGSKLLAESIIDKAFRHALQVAIGKVYSAETLGFFTQSNNFCNMLANNFQQAIQKVTYPVLAKLQDNRKKLKEGYRQIIIMSSFAIIPLMVIMGVLAEPLMLTFVGEKWLKSVPFLQLLVIAGITYHFNSINLDLLLVLGRVDLCLRLEVIKKVIAALTMFLGYKLYDLYGLVMGQVISNYIALLINTYYSDKFLDYPLLEQIRDILPTIVFSAVMGSLIFIFLYYVPLPNSVILFVGSGLGLMAYMLMHYLADTKEIALLREYIIPKTIKFITNKA
ncbi:MAG: lipopolysaccharide biosynthesis protein [Saprospiraceae bacterium]|nr:MAG: lipopolysaccharide biosynthesis protein [Saprospiraceae bacterium]